MASLVIHDSYLDIAGHSSIRGIIFIFCYGREQPQHRSNNPFRKLRSGSSSTPDLSFGIKEIEMKDSLKYIPQMENSVLHFVHVPFQRSGGFSSLGASDQPQSPIISQTIDFSILNQFDLCCRTLKLI